MKSVIESYGIIQQVRELKLTPVQMISLSVVAGISEEFLFRAAIQPLLGVWLTSAIFIGIHGYIRFSTFPKLLYTLFTFLLSCALGRSEEHTSELQSRGHLVCRLLLEKKNET